MLRSSVLACVIGVAAVSLGCSDPELPMSPDELETGVVLFEHANFRGNSAHVTSDIPDLRDFMGPCLHGDDAAARDWNDCISSVSVAPGWRATIYRDTGYDDDFLEITGDVPNLALMRGDCDHDGLNDCISSIRVRPE